MKKKLATAGDDESQEDQAFARTPYFFTFHTAFHMLWYGNCQEVRDPWRQKNFWFTWSWRHFQLEREKIVWCWKRVLFWLKWFLFQLLSLALFGSLRLFFLCSPSPLYLLFPFDVDLLLGVNFFLNESIEWRGQKKMIVVAIIEERRQE